MRNKAPKRVAPLWAPVLAFVLLGLLPARAWPTDASFFNGHGFDPYRGTLSKLPWEHIDPMTGNVLLTFTDFSFPGDGGLGLTIQRTYNSKIHNDLGQNLLGEISWAGLGWSLHMGRVFMSVSCTLPPISFETPDGSEHPLYLHPDNNGGHYQTRELWTYETGTPKLRMTNGLVYTFGACVAVPFGNFQPSRSARYATLIEDPFGNRIDIAYNTGTVATTINTITQTMVGGDVRSVRFQCGTPPQQCDNSHKQLSEIALLDGAGFPTSTWTFAQTTIGTDLTQLTAAQPPEGPAWQFAYYSQSATVPYVIADVTTPNGGTVSYVHERHNFTLGSSAWQSAAVISRVVGGRLPAGGGGTWSYLYELVDEGSQDVHHTTVTCDTCSRKTVQRFLDIDFSDPAPQAWRLGALESTEIKETANSWEKETLSWIASPPISKNGVPQGNDPYTRAPLLQQRQIQRGTASYTTTYTYTLTGFNANQASNFADYGRPYQTDETGELTRTNTRTFFYDPGNHYNGFGVYSGSYVVDRTETEMLFSGGESYTNDYGYRTTGGYKGFLESQTIRGITTTFTPQFAGSGETGNVASATDGNGNQTSYTYDWGVQKNVTTEEYVIGRMINYEGTVQSETRNGFMTTFLYDDLFRPTKKTPPSVNPPSNPTDIAYDNVNAHWVKTSRGNSFTQTNIDGFGRPADTVNSVSVKTQVLYDGCGRAYYQSYPFEGTANKGDTLQFDPLDRVTRRTHPDNTFATYDYAVGAAGVRNGIDLDIYDEENRHGFQDWSAFGDPGDARLMSVQAAMGTADSNTTTYTYNGLGSLKSVTPVGADPGLIRTWTYYAGESGGKPGLLKTETNPENGSVDYTYDEVGNVRTRKDAKYAPDLTRLCYDGNNRLIRVAFPTTSSDDQCSSYDKLFAYDDADNKTREEAPGVTSDFEYDDVNRLRSRLDTFPGDAISFTTSYVPDNNDNVRDLVYPVDLFGPPRTVRYSYDTENRILSAGTGVAGNDNHYADNALYHPSGALKSLNWGNGRSTTLTYDLDRYWISTISTNPSGVLGLNYQTYDAVGNVLSLVDSRGPTYSQALSYDSLDRLKQAGPSALGVWDYTYNKRGDRLTKTKAGSPPITITYTYGDGTNGPPNNHLLRAEPGNVDFTHDANGNMTGDEFTYVYTYTPENLLATVNPVAGSPVTTYTYDGSGLRKRKVTTQAGQTQTRTQYFVHGPQGQLLSEFSFCGGSPLKLKDYIYLGQRLLAAMDSTIPPQLYFSAGNVLDEWQPNDILAVTLFTSDGCLSESAVTVDYAAASGTATAGTDFIVTPGTLTFPAGSYSGSLQFIPVTVINDTEVEQPDEFFSLTFSNATGAVLPSPSTVNVPIRDDDGTVEVSPTAVSVAEDAGTATGTLRLVTSNNFPLSNQVYATYATANGAPGPSGAVAPADYIAQGGTVTFNVGEATNATRNALIPIVNDTASECTENFYFQLTAVQNGSMSPQNTATVTIQDDDLAVVNVGPASVTEGNTGTSPAPVRVTLSQPSCNTVTVAYATSDGTAVSSGPYPDYQFAAGTVTFINPSTATTVNVPIVGDTVHEVTQSFNVTLSNPTNATIGQAQAAVEILDTDAPPVLSIAGPVPIPPEGDEGTTLGPPFVVSPSGNLSEPTATVDYATEDGTAEASQPDYLVTSGTLSFPPYSTASQSLTVSIVGDSVDEPQENYFVNLSNPVHATIGVGQATGNIADDDPPAISSTELFHGVEIDGALNGGLPIVDWYRIGQKPYASYEVITDGTKGGSEKGFIEIARFDENLVLIGAGSMPVGGSGGHSRSLRWENWPGTGPSVGVTNEPIRVHRAACSPSCGRSQYRVRLFETTYSIVRFNNTGGQATTVVIQNNGGDVVNGHIHFWDGSGNLLASALLSAQPSPSLDPKEVSSLDTTTIPSLVGQAGSITLSSGGRYGVLSGKAVSIDSAAGLVFESVMEPRR